MRETPTVSDMRRRNSFSAGPFLSKGEASVGESTRPVSNPTTHQVTRLLLAWSGGDAVASEQLMSAVYEELRHLARGYLRGERSDHTLQPTALVHEAYLRLVDGARIDWKSRAQFYGIAARVMPPGSRRSRPAQGSGQARRSGGEDSAGGSR